MTRGVVLLTHFNELDKRGAMRLTFFKNLLGMNAAIFALSAPVLAWDDHQNLTRSILSELREIENLTVPYTPLEELIRDLGFQSRVELNESIQIHRDFEFEPKLFEVKGSSIEVIDILSVYSDEPDWKMDQELFEPDQYPELWKKEYSMMGGKKGTPSQAFRHMYWRSFSARDPLQTFKLPVSRLLRSMGQAHSRGEVFIELSRVADELQHPYWAIRFLANALHYLEDVAVPFHSSQTPTKKFIWMPFNRTYGSGLKDYVTQVTQLIAYYHFAFEFYVAEVLRSEPYGPFVQALSDRTIEFPAVDYSDLSMKNLVLKMAHRSSELSARAGRVSISFFPPVEVPYATLDPKKIMTDEWKARVMKKEDASSEVKSEYFKIVREMFEPLGFSVRQVVLGELGRMNSLSAKK